MYGEILQTGPLLPQSIIANGLSTGVGWSNPNNLFQADGSTSQSNANGASDIVIGNYNFALPQNAVITGIEMTLIVQSLGSPMVSPPLTLIPYAYDDTGTVPASYPYSPSFTSFTPTLTNYVLGGQNYLFATSWTVDQINNFKLDLVSNGGMGIDTVLVNIYYYLTPPPPSPEPVGDSCETCNSPVQSPFFTLATPLLAGDTSMTLSSFNFANGSPIPSSVLGSCGGWLSMTIDPGLRKGSDGTGNFEENVVVTSWSTLPSGNVVLNFGSSVNRGRTPFEPYTYNSAYASGHDAGSKVVLSDNAEFLNRFVRACQVGIIFSAPIEVLSNGASVVFPATNFNFKSGFSVTQNGSNSEQADIVATGNSVPPPIIVGVGSGSSGNVQVTNLTYTVPVSGTDRAALVQISTEQVQTITGVTVGGVACMQLVVSTDSGTNIREEQWICVAPPNGTQNVIITLSGAAYVTSGTEALANVDQSTPTGATQDADGTSLAPSLSITTTRDNSTVIDGLATAMTPILYTPGAGQTISWSATANLNTRQGGSSFEIAGTEPDPVTMQYTITQNTKWCYTAVEVLGIVPPVTGVESVTDNGNGHVTVDNTDPQNPIIDFDGVSVDGTTITGTGLPGDPLIAVGGGSGGITSINGNTNAAQTIAAGSGIAVTSTGGTTTISNTGSGGGYFVSAGQLVSGTSIVNVTIIHTLGVAPAYVKVHANGFGQSTGAPSFTGSYGVYDVVNAVYYTAAGNSQDTAHIVNVNGNSGNITLTATVTSATSSNVVLTIPAGTGLSCGYVIELVS